MPSTNERAYPFAKPPFKNAYWVAPGLLLAGPFPGDRDPSIAETKIRTLAHADVRAVINLQPTDERGTEGETFPNLTSTLSGRHITVERFPISDMDVPSRATMSSILDRIDEHNAAGRTVYVHCWGGHGRTGVVVGCWLQRHGLAGKVGALRRIAELRASAGIKAVSPQTAAQRNMVSAWPTPDSVPLPNRLAGGVWGALVGDALGVPYEFGPRRDPASIAWGATGAHGQPPGTWSDDGGLFLALLDSFLDAGFDLRDQARRALAWLDGPDYKPGERFDVGIGTSTALSAIRSGAEPEEAGGGSERDNGNGSLMRILPVALCTRGDPIQLIERAERASSVTHKHVRSRLVCALYCLVARQLLRGETDRQTALDSAVRDLITFRSRKYPTELDLIVNFVERSGSGYVVDSFWSAWTAFDSADSYEACVRQAVAFGGDTDTTACVAGGLAGVYWGMSGIPGDWLMSMRGRSIVAPLVARLLQAETASPTTEGSP
jgi:ADP-ribosyl-[dinitrogen reductase] hydrolase